MRKLEGDIALLMIIHTENQSAASRYLASPNATDIIDPRYDNS